MVGRTASRNNNLLSRLALALIASGALLTVAIAPTVARAQAPSKAFELPVDQDDEFLANLEYDLDGETQRPPNDEALVNNLEKLGLVDITEGLQPLNEKLGLSHVFVSDSMEKMVALRYDFIPKDRTLIGQVLKLPSGRFVFHTKTADRRHVAVFFEGFRQSEINPITMRVSLSRASRPSFSMLFLDFAINRAHAKGHECTAVAPPIHLTAGHPESTPAKIFKQVSVCSRSFITAVTDALDINVLSFLRGEWIGGLKSAYAAVKYVFTNGPADIIRALGDVALNISGELMTATLCYVLSTMAAETAIGLMTGGLGLAAFVTKFMLKIRKLDKIVKGLMETHRIRELRTLSSGLKGKTFVPRVRPGERSRVLAEKLRFAAPVVHNVTEAKTAQSTMTRALRQSSCVAKTEIQNALQSGASVARSHGRPSHLRPIIREADRRPASQPRNSKTRSAS